MLIITRSGTVPTDLVPSLFVEDSVYLMLGTNAELRVAILDKLGQEVLVIDRLGKNVKEGSYRRESAEIYDSPELKDKEVGLYLEL